MTMESNKKVGRLTGVLLLFVFISGIIIFQFLQGAVLFSDNFITTTSENANQIISSTLLGIFSGIASLAIATLLLPLFKKQNIILAYLYFAFCIISFIALLIDNVSVISMLELSNEYLKSENKSSVRVLENLVYERHRWTHYFYLLISCFPVFILYCTLYLSKLVPRIISIFGLFAVSLMFIEVVLSIYGQGIGMNMMIPMALIQLTLPLWLLFKGFNSSVLTETRE